MHNIYLTQYFYLLQRLTQQIWVGARNMFCKTHIIRNTHVNQLEGPVKQIMAFDVNKYIYIYIYKIKISE